MLIFSFPQSLASALAISCRFIGDVAVKVRGRGHLNLLLSMGEGFKVFHAAVFCVEKKACNSDT